MDPLTKEITKIVREQMEALVGDKMMVAAAEAVDKRQRTELNKIAKKVIDGQMAEIIDILKDRPLPQVTQLLLRSEAHLTQDVVVTGEGDEIVVQSERGRTGTRCGDRWNGLHGHTYGQDRVHVGPGKYRMLLMFIPKEEGEKIDR